VISSVYLVKITQKHLRTYLEHIVNRNNLSTKVSLYFKMMMTFICLNL